jgi:hypothetical protein
MGRSVSAPIDWQGPRFGHRRLELLGEVGRQKVGGLGEVFAGPRAPPAVTLPYAGARLGVSWRSAAPRSLLVGLWAIVHADLRSETTATPVTAYRIRGAALGLLLRFGFEVGPDP